MDTIPQILLGTALLGASAVVHVGVVAFTLPYFVKISNWFPEMHRPRLRVVVMLMTAVFMLVLAHTLQVWGWAICFLMLTDLPDMATGFYFTTVTYTTLGYGDIVLGPDARILATFCAITGLLTFGISTAFLIGVLTRIMPTVFDDGDRL